MTTLVMIEALATTEASATIELPAIVEMTIKESFPFYPFFGEKAFSVIFPEINSSFQKRRYSINLFEMMIYCVF